MFGLLRERAEKKRRERNVIERGREAGRSMTAAVHGYLHLRLEQIAR
jgi:hypothetical protein